MNLKIIDLIIVYQILSETMKKKKLNMRIVVDETSIDTKTIDSRQLYINFKQFSAFFWKVIF